MIGSALEQDEPAQGDLPKPPAARVRRASGRVRRPAAATDVQQIREAIADLRGPAAASPAPVYRYLTVDGIEGDVRTQARLRAKILVAHRLAARGRRWVFLPEPGRLTLSIAGDDA